MAYIANKPVRFDRDYKVGEIIPDEVIAPGMTRKLVEMGDKWKSQAKSS